MHDALLDQSLWYKDAVIYEVHIRSFYDSNADGIGDFRGLIEKLDYIQFLGTNLIWLLPFYPSPLKDDGYDIADYTNVNPIYGSLTDFKAFLRAAHKRDIRVMIELVLNHTSNEHIWFQRSRRAKPNSFWRDFYVWSDSPDRFPEARIIFKDFEASNWSFDPIANAYYWHRFYSHQPDLNFDNPHVRKAMLKIVDFWLRLGVDGLRLDAIPYLYEREGTSCENLPETHQFLRELRAHVDHHFKNRLLLAEANQWPDDAVAYFSQGDACHMAFHFPMMPRMFTAIEMEDRFPLVDILQETPVIPDNCQWATFLRNHDELTLEMVTDEERDYMYRIYADDPQMRINLGIRRRLAPLMRDRRKIELMNGLLFTLPGTPVIYYGDEIGMGDNIYLGDRNSLRTPMQWSRDLNAGFSKATPQKLYLPVVIDPDYNYESINVELEQHNDQSLLWWTKRLIAMRQRFKAFGYGKIIFLFPDNHKILAFLRTHQDETLLVVANLSRFTQFAELDLNEFAGKNLVEVFGDTTFPIIDKSPYFITLQAYSFFCFKISVTQKEVTQQQHPETSILPIQKSWEELLHKSKIKVLENILQTYLPFCKWYPEKTEKIYNLSIIDQILLFRKPYVTYILIIKIQFKEKSESFLLPVSSIEDQLAAKLNEEQPQALIVHFKKANGILETLVDALSVPQSALQLLRICARRNRFKNIQSEIITKTSQSFKQIFNKDLQESDIKPMQGEQSNTSIIYGDRGILKIFRRMEYGINPDVEICEFLTDQIHFPNAPRLASTIEYRSNQKTMTLGILQELIQHQGTAWAYTLDTLQIFFANALSKYIDKELQLPTLSLSPNLADPPEEIFEIIGPFAKAAQLLGQRTAELHQALAASNHPDFKPELFTIFDQRALYQSIHGLCRKNFEYFGKKNNFYSPETQTEINNLLTKQTEIFNLAKQIVGQKINGQKIRCHGDFHLGQVLYTGKDFFIIDFEGEPDRPLSERRIKRSPLRDVASMLRSFHYAVSTALFDQAQRGTAATIDLNKWSLYWHRWISQLYLQGYVSIMMGSKLIPSESNHFALLLRLFMLEKVIYEIDYEIHHRPDWLKIPCHGLLELIEVES